MKSSTLQLQKVRRKIELERQEIEIDYLIFKNRFLKFLNPINNYFGIGNVEDFSWFYGFISLASLIILATFTFSII